MSVQVSIICNTYNHEQFIKDALDGFLMQKTNFEYEVLVHDDASTDNTPAIIDCYKQKYPNIIKPIFQKENKYSLGINITREYQLPRAKGKYIAICEGDDYWTDERKLQIQFDILEQNIQVDMCAHAAEEIDWLSNQKVGLVAPAESDCILSLEDVVTGGGSYLATASLMYRKQIETTPPDYRKVYGIDYTLQVSGAFRGGIYYVNRTMSVYRFLTPGSWTKLLKKDHHRKLTHKLRMRKVLKLIDNETERKYHSYIRKQLLDNYIKSFVLRIVTLFE